MNTRLTSRRGHYITRAGVFLITVALIAGMIGCTFDTDTTPPIRYNLTIADAEGGSVAIPGQGTFTYDAGTVATLVATPASGYRFVSWTGNVDTIADPNTASTTITMNGNYSIRPSFYQEEGAVTYYTLTMAITGSGSTSPAVGQRSYAAGTQVPISATPAGGWQFVDWTGHTATVANPDAASTTITMHGNYSITANFQEAAVTYYTLTIAVTGSGSTSPAVGQHSYAAGTQVSISATPAGGWQFVNWMGDTATIGNVNSSSTTITMHGSYSITAKFEEAPVTYYTLTIAVTGSGSTSPAVGQHSYAAGTQVSISATPAVGWQFLNWTGDTATIANANAASTTITMNGSYSITAKFEEAPVTYYTLTMAVTGSGSTSPAVGQHTYAASTEVSISATPAGGWQFVNWTGNVGTIANANAASTTITINGNYSITANFEEGDGVVFPDPNLEAAIREAIGKPTGAIYQSDLEGLTSLSASHQSITNLSGLEYCINLTSLDLSHNRIGDISPLAHLTSLAWLALSYNQISDISPLAGLTNLTWLELSYNQIGSIFPLANLTKLAHLFLHSNQISNIEPLANLTNLTRLFLFSNQISSIFPLANLTNVRRLYLHNNQISSVSPLANLTSLTWLYLHNNQINDISFLGSLTKLTQLGLSYNEISDIEPLANLTSLTYLFLHSNQITDISPLANLTSLKWLYLHNNNISDIYPLVQNDGLGAGDRVNLEGNPLSGDSTTHIHTLEERGVIVFYD